MGRPLMLQDKDHEKIEKLRKALGIGSKADVLRAGIELLEKEAERQERVARFQRAAAMAAKTSRQVNAEFRPHSRLKRI